MRVNDLMFHAFYRTCQLSTWKVILYELLTLPGINLLNTPVSLYYVGTWGYMLHRRVSVINEIKSPTSTLLYVCSLISDAPCFLEFDYLHYSWCPVPNDDYLGLHVHLCSVLSGHLVSQGRFKYYC